jgi:hypothetical protein
MEQINGTPGQYSSIMFYESRHIPVEQIHVAPTLEQLKIELAVNTQPDNSFFSWQKRTLATSNGTHFTVFSLFVRAPNSTQSTVQ